MRFVILATALLSGSALSAVPESVRQEILDRCQRSMDGFGHALVKVCVDEDIKAYTSLHGESRKTGGKMDSDQTISELRKEVRKLRGAIVAARLASGMALSWRIGSDRRLLDTTINLLDRVTLTPIPGEDAIENDRIAGFKHFNSRLSEDLKNRFAKLVEGLENQ